MIHSKIFWMQMFSYNTWSLKITVVFRVRSKVHITRKCLNVTCVTWQLDFLKDAACFRNGIWICITFLNILSQTMPRYRLPLEVIAWNRVKSRNDRRELNFSHLNSLHRERSDAWCRLKMRLRRSPFYDFMRSCHPGDC